MEPTYEPPLGDGRTDFDDDPIEVTLTAAGPSILPSSLRRLEDEPRAAAMAIARTATVVHQALQQLESDVAAARELGVSWAAIGWTLGMTGEGARKRFGDPS